jgi:pantoate--beta-alanine ligase
LAKRLYDQGERRAAVILSEVKGLIGRYPQNVIDYVKICDAKTLEEVDLMETEAVLALAVKVGATRLIDNHVFGEELNI